MNQEPCLLIKGKGPINVYDVVQEPATSTGYPSQNQQAPMYTKQSYE